MSGTLTLEELRTRTTIAVPEAGAVLGIGRKAAYDAAEAGTIPVLRLGRCLRVPVPALLALLGVDPTTQSDASSSIELAPAPILTLAKEKDLDQRTPTGPNSAA